MKIRIKNIFLGLFASVSALIVFLVFGLLFSNLVQHGFQNWQWGFLTEIPLRSGRAGGIGPILISTIAIVGLSLLIALPLGLSSALLLTEVIGLKNVFGRVLTRSLEVLAGVPSIVFGLFGNAVFCKTLGLGFSILSGALTLACMMLPLLIKACEESLRAVPSTYRIAGTALNISKTGMYLKVILPAARPGIFAGIVLALGRATAETAALIFTSGYVDRWPESILDSGRSLSVHIYDLAMNVSGGDPNAYKSALVLITFLFIVNGLSGIISKGFFRRRHYVAS